MKEADSGFFLAIRRLILFVYHGVFPVFLLRSFLVHCVRDRYLCVQVDERSDG